MIQRFCYRTYEGALARHASYEGDASARRKAASLVTSWGVAFAVVVFLCPFVAGWIYEANTDGIWSPVLMLGSVPLTALFAFRYIEMASLVFAGKTKYSSIKAKADALAKDKTLSADWQRRAKVIQGITRQLNAKEKIYGKRPEIDKIREELDAAINGIISYSMMLHGEHSEVVKREVDTILESYGELAA